MPTPPAAEPEPEPRREPDRPDERLHAVVRAVNRIGMNGTISGFAIGMGLGHLTWAERVEPLLAFALGLVAFILTMISQASADDISDLL